MVSESHFVRYTYVTMIVFFTLLNALMTLKLSFSRPRFVSYHLEVK